MDQYTLSDVLMPIIGNEVTLPEDSLCKQIIDEIMEKENIDETEFLKAQKYSLLIYRL